MRANNVSPASEGAPPREDPVESDRPSRHIRRSGKIRGFHVSPKAADGRIPFWTDLQQDVMRLLDIDQRVRLYGPCSFPPVVVPLGGKLREYRALLTVHLVRTAVVFDIVREEGSLTDTLRSAYAAQGLAYTCLEERRIRQDPAFTNALEIEHARCVPISDELTLFAQQALGRGITTIGEFEAALVTWQAGRPLPRGGVMIKPRMLAYALFLRGHIRFDPFTALVTEHTMVTM